jgi:hypothetical protein
MMGREVGGLGSSASAGRQVVSGAPHMASVVVVVAVRETGGAVASMVHLEQLWVTSGSLICMALPCLTTMPELWPEEVGVQGIPGCRTGWERGERQVAGACSVSGEGAGGVVEEAQARGGREGRAHWWTGYLWAGRTPVTTSARSMRRRRRMTGTQITQM